jgi:uncharacterized protein YcnI
MGSSSRFVSRGLLTAMVLALTGVVGLVLSPAAWADITITPSQADQGGAANVMFRVPDDRGKAYTTKVEVKVPTGAPIGEVYPLSVQGWAPKIQYQKLAKPIQGLHGVTSAITTAVVWTRVDPPTDGKGFSELGLSMGPLPKVAEVPFSVVQTYSDGTVRQWNGPVLKLLAEEPIPGVAPVPTKAGMQNMPGMEGMPGMGAPAGAADVPDTPVGPSDSDGPMKFFVLSLVGGLLFLALVAGFIVTSKRRPEAEDLAGVHAEPGTEVAAEKNGSEQHA